MGTLVTAEVVAEATEVEVRGALSRALGWFASVEATASRFDPSSELRRLCARPGEAVPVSPPLFEALRFALALAERSGGAFDPTVGARLQGLGFDRHHVTGARDPAADLEPATYRDVELDGTARTVRLRRRLLLDLGAVAKGLAIDLAARELARLGGFCVEAGGDLYAGGLNGDGEPWRVGIQHPRDPDALADVILAADAAVCTSGDYERRTADGAAHHLVDGRGGPWTAAGDRVERGGRVASAGDVADELASVTVVAPSALVADGLATAAFVLGRAAGRRLLEEQGVDGLLITPAGDNEVVGAPRRAT